MVTVSAAIFIIFIINQIFNVGGLKTVTARSTTECKLGVLDNSVRIGAPEEKTLMTHGTITVDHKWMIGVSIEMACQ